VQFLEVVVVPVGLTPGWMFYHAIVASFRKAPYGRHSEAALLTICSQTVRILWTCQHTSVARLQVRRTMLDTSVCRGQAGRVQSRHFAAPPSEPPVGSILCQVIA
jgi:hypothetical protein